MLVADSPAARLRRTETVAAGAQPRSGAQNHLYRLYTCVVVVCGRRLFSRGLRSLPSARFCLSCAVISTMPSLFHPSAAACTSPSVAFLAGHKLRIAYCAIDHWRVDHVTAPNHAANKGGDGQTDRPTYVPVDGDAVM
jgi:hypothetical protein